MIFSLWLEKFFCPYDLYKVQLCELWKKALFLIFFPKVFRMKYLFVFPFFRKWASKHCFTWVGCSSFCTDVPLMIAPKKMRMWIRLGYWCKLVCKLFTMSFREHLCILTTSLDSLICEEIGSHLIFLLI